MREQDYMKIMNGLREDYITEAVNWDGTAQKNRRSIRRMSLGVGAIAAAMAVVVGGIGYGIYRDRLTANPQQENSDITIEKLNILGGHGELHGYLTTSGDCFFRIRDIAFFVASFNIFSASVIYKAVFAMLSATDGLRVFSNGSNSNRILFLTTSGTRLVLSVTYS